MWAALVNQAGIVSQTDDVIFVCPGCFKEISHKMAHRCHLLVRLGTVRGQNSMPTNVLSPLISGPIPKSSKQKKKIGSIWLIGSSGIVHQW
ncbi:hypothetical protein GDO78_011165 [Eleutherodactylus coqui]|uniref:Uncharacterized protein n=1 Tax=Eleutherodactylus coqui TaxID=57060 RepID=A0A8J6K756_ELECQ|nr:hypothetical protein GDO78_011165 [Eleutherodactylus coqui]